jgi:rhamnogalacturonan acetylesterase
VFSGVAETVLTYEAYLVNAANLFKSKGANVIISSATPNNPWETGSFVYSTSRFTTFASDAAKNSGSTFIDHGTYTANKYKALGECGFGMLSHILMRIAGAATVDSYYPNDHTHTSPGGANVVAGAFIQGLEASSSTLKNYIIRHV